jgi:hypothetical protein
MAHETEGRPRAVQQALGQQFGDVSDFDLLFDVLALGAVDEHRFAERTADSDGRCPRPHGLLGALRRPRPRFRTGPLQVNVRQQR